MENPRFSCLLSTDVICDFSHAKGGTKGGRGQKRGPVKGGGVRGVHGINPRPIRKHGEEKSELSSHTPEPPGGRWYASKVLSCTFSGISMEGAPPGVPPGLIPESNSGGHPGKFFLDGSTSVRRTPIWEGVPYCSVWPDLIQLGKEQDIVQHDLFLWAYAPLYNVLPDLIQPTKEQDIVQHNLSLDIVRYRGLKNPVEGEKAPGRAQLCNHMESHDLVTKFIDRRLGIRYERTELGEGRLEIGDLRSGAARPTTTGKFSRYDKTMIRHEGGIRLLGWQHVRVWWRGAFTLLYTKENSYK